MEKFVNFNQLVEMWKLSDSVGLLYSKQDELYSVTYREMAERILAQKFYYSQEIDPLLMMICDNTPEAIYRLMGAVLAGKDIVLAEDGLPSSILVRMRDNATFIEPQKPVNGEMPEGRILFYTSGTTSRSKAVILTTEKLLASAWSGQNMLPCKEGDTILSILPLSHVFGFVCSFLWGVCYGATIAVGRGIRYFMDDCNFFHPTILPVVPTMLDMLIRLDALNPELDVVLVGAAPASLRSVNYLKNKGIRIYLGYGLTETSSGVAITQDQSDPYAMTPCPGVDLRIEADGEISIEAPTLMLGYVGDDTGIRDGRFYTGDLGRLDEKGRLYITGRKKDMLVLRDGTKVYCPEYEEELAPLLGTRELCTVLYNERPSLVIGKDPKTGEPVPEEKRPAIREAVDTYNKQYPRSQQLCDIIYLDGILPRTATGKLQRWKIQDELKLGDLPILQ